MRSCFSVLSDEVNQYYIVSSLYLRDVNQIHLKIESS